MKSLLETKKKLMEDTLAELQTSLSQQNTNLQEVHGKIILHQGALQMVEMLLAEAFPNTAEALSE